MMATAFIVGVFYCLDALYGERRDRSILFWKSLPVSDLTTVLSKASIPLVVLPLLTFAITVATQWIMLLLSTAVLLGSGLSVAPLWTRSCRCSRCRWCCSTTLWPCMCSGMRPSTAGCCWSQPGRGARHFYGPPCRWLAIGIVEKIAFNTSHFAALLGYRFSGSAAGGSFTADNVSMDPLMQLTPGKFLSSAGSVDRAGIFAAFLAAAVRLRRYQGPI